MLHVDGATGIVDTLLVNPPLSAPADLVVRRDGAILVADSTLGLVEIDPVTGTSILLATPAALGGAPTVLAFESNGDLIVGGPGGLRRFAGGRGTPQPLTPAGVFGSPHGIAPDGAGTLWVTDEPPSGPPVIWRVSASTGSATVFPTTCPTNTFPVSPRQIRRGPDGNLYVVNGPYGGPTNYNNAGIFRVNPATGEATRSEFLTFIRGFDFASDGREYVCYAHSISRTPWMGWIRVAGVSTFLTDRGPLAIVPDGVTTTRARTWGALKRLYR